jgi:hypothetical protein
MAIFNFLEMAYVEHIWYVAFEGTDWMCVMYKDTTDGPWIGRYRFNYYHSDQPFDEKDKKNVYQMSLKDGGEESRKKMVHTLEIFSTIMTTKMEGECWSLPVQGDAIKAVSVLDKQPWIHKRHVPLDFKE